ncbi:sensor histidine kinase [Paenibacillus sp. FSL W7-1287]|uniref:sensor histidine kinase n=1 Tax=Paenibacillus sp. FSL W7-1287 TaxID=2954538 RepID=UPI0030FB37F9
MTLIIYGIMEHILLLLAFFYIIDKKPSRKQLLLYIGIIVAPTTILMYLTPQYIAIAYLVISAHLLYYYFERTIFSIISCSVIIVSTIISDYFSMLLQPTFSKVLGSSGTLALTLLFFVLMFTLLIYWYKQYMYRQFQALEPPWYIKALLVAILLSTIVVVYMNIFDTRDSTSEIILMNLVIQISYFISMIVLSSLLILYMKKRNAIHFQEMEQEQFLHYMSELELVNHDMHKFRHDYVNILLTMRGYLDDNNLEGLRQYFHEHILKVEQQTLHHHLMFMQFKNIKIQELKGLIATKLITAEKNGIVVNVEIPDLITSIDMNMIDLARVIGALLDNAIEASECIEHPSINLAIIDTVNGAIVIVIENRATLEGCNVHRIFEEHYSTKGKNRGLGLATVNRIVHQYPNAHLETLCEPGWFTQKLTIEAAVSSSAAAASGTA